MDFARLTSYFEQIEGTGGRKAMVQLLADIFRDLPAAEVEPIVYLCQGRLAPIYEPIEIGMGEQLVADAIARATGIARARIQGYYGELGDLGLAAERALGERAQEGLPPTDVLLVYRTLREIAETNGEGSIERKVVGLASLLRRLDPRSARYLTRVPLGRLRLGVGDDTLLDALSQARTHATRDRASLERAYALTSDLGQVARVYLTAGLDAVQALRLQVGKPLRPALAERLPSPEAVITKLGRSAVEPKYDGFRCQVHREGDAVKIFSRNLEDMSAMFPEVVNAVRTQLRAQTAIVEGEAVAYIAESDEYRPFQETTRRRRKHNIAEVAEELPLRLCLFDAMLVDGQDITHLPYTERRQRLEALCGPGDVLRVTERILTEDPAELRNFFLAKVGSGLEGVVVKRPDSPYQAGARNFNWVKLKRDTETTLRDTVDCVVIGYIRGRGKRAELGAGALLVGVYDDQRDEFTSITKIGTGLSDQEWRDVTARCDQLAVPHKPARVNAVLEPDVWVNPEIVVEVLADEITRSPAHTTGRTREAPGYALRFPRLIRFRDRDKRPEDATTVREIVEMYERRMGRGGQE